MGEEEERCWGIGGLIWTWTGSRRNENGEVSERIGARVLGLLTFTGKYGVFGIFYCIQG